MKYVLLILGLWSILATGCTRSYPRPADLIGEEEMIDILVDAHFAEAILLYEESHTGSSDSLSPIVMARVFRKHNVSREQFDQSLDYYIHYPEQLRAMYEEVFNTISVYDAEVKSKPADTEDKEEETHRDRLAATVSRSIPSDTV